MKSPAQFHAEQSSDRRDMALYGRWLRVAWLALVVIAVFILGVFVFSFTVPTPPGPFATDPTARANLLAAGLAPQHYDAIQRALRVAMAVVCYMVGLMLLWRRPMDRMALFVAFLLVGVSIGTTEETTLTVLPTVLAFPANALKFIWYACVPAFFYLFPNGRWVPHWTRWLVLLWVWGQVYRVTLAPPLGIRPPAWISVLNQLLFLAYLGNLVMLVGAPVYRYVRVSRPVERQQTKWLLAGIAGVGVPGLLLLLTEIIFPSFAPNGSLVYVVGQVFVEVMLLFVPISIGYAMLRYRLYDIDLIIRRTLIYTVLTSALVVIYWGSVLVLQEIVSVFTRQTKQPPLVIVASTLAIVALFRPLRRRVQAIIDRRFYRRKYNAQQTLQAFSAKMRVETDLDTLRGDLVQVAHDTLEPAHVSLWLREGQRNG